MLFLWISLIIALALAALVVLLSYSFRNKRQPHRRTPRAFGIDFEAVRFGTRNGKTLYGWWIPADRSTSTGPVIILVHGWGRNVERMLPYIEKLHPAGYHLLAFDSRHHGSSDTDGFSSMLKFAEDITAAIDYAVGRSETHSSRIGVLGLSIGGSASIYAAAHDPRIRAAVTVGAFAHPASIMSLEFRKAHIPYFPLLWLLYRYLEFRIGARLDDIAPVNNIQNVKAQLLMIHGDRDTVVPLEEAERLAKASRSSTAELWVVPGKGHSDCHTHPDFWSRVTRFYADALRPSAESPG